jgi:hypothetical protein
VKELQTKEVGWVAKFVEDIHQEPFTPYFRGEALGPTVQGWGERLLTYSWRGESSDFSTDLCIYNVLLEQIRPSVELVLARSRWSHAKEDQAVEAALEIFRWGGIVRRRPKAQHVRDVLEMALLGSSSSGDAPMNSSWTKLAALATHGAKAPHVIWDSRVATSVTSRLDALFYQAGLRHVPVDHEISPRLGVVRVGRGGSRPRSVRLPWPNAYHSWHGQCAGSDFVRNVRDHLNANLKTYSKKAWRSPIEGYDPRGPWSLREVEQVLFMDGY